MNISINRQSLDKNTKSLKGGAKVVSSNWKLHYLDLNQVDLSAILRLKQEDFKLNNVEFKYQTDSSKYLISLILSQYFVKKLKV